MDSRITSVFGRDNKYIGDLLTVMMTSSHPLRPEAEEIFNLCKQTDPNQLALKLANLLEESSNVETRARSAIQLEEMFEPDSREDQPESSETASMKTSGESKCKPLAEFTRSMVKYILLRCVGKEHNRIVMKSLCRTIAKGFNVFCRKNGWPELFSFVSRCVSGSNVLVQEACMLILTSLRFSLEDQPFPLEVYLTCLKNTDNADVRIAAFGAAISYIIRCTHMRVAVDLFPAMRQVLTEGLNGGQEVTKQEALKLLIEWVAHSAEFGETYLFRMNFSDRELVRFVRSAINIAESQSLEKETRHLAIDFLLKLGEGRILNFRNMMRRSPCVFNSLFGILMLMLSDIENEAASHWAENEDDDDDAGESRNYSVLHEFLARLAIKLDEDSVDWLMLEQYLAASEWQKRVTAIVVLAQIPELYLKVTKKSFLQLVIMVLDLFQDSYPRVRMTAINTTVRLTTINATGQYNRLVLPALTTATYEDPDTRVRLAAINATVRLTAINATGQYNSRVLSALTTATYKDPDTRVRLAAINAIGQFFTALDQDLQLLRLQYNRLVLPALATATYKDPDTRMRLAAINAICQLFTALDRDLQSLYANAIYDFQHPQVQAHAASAVVTISKNYPPETLTPYLLEIVGTLLEFREREEIASDQTRILALKKLLKQFPQMLPKATWNLIWSDLRLDQQAKFVSAVK